MKRAANTAAFSDTLSRRSDTATPAIKSITAENFAQEEIAKRACTLWERDGRPGGGSMAFWHRAELELRSEKVQLHPSDTARTTG
jgi:hypothetical protein